MGLVYVQWAKTGVKIAAKATAVQGDQRIVGEDLESYREE